MWRSRPGWTDCWWKIRARRERFAVLGVDRFGESGAGGPPPVYEHLGLTAANAVGDRQEFSGHA